MFNEVVNFSGLVNPFVAFLIDISIVLLICLYYGVFDKEESK